MQKLESTNVNVFTNGSSLTLPDGSSLIDELKQANVSTIFVSIDGLSKYQDYIRLFSDIERVKRNIELLQRHFDVVISATLSNTTLEHMSDLAENFIKLYDDKNVRLSVHVIGDEDNLYSIYNIPESFKKELISKYAEEFDKYEELGRSDMSAHFKFLTDCLNYEQTSCKFNSAFFIEVDQIDHKMKMNLDEACPQFSKHIQPYRMIT